MKRLALCLLPLLLMGCTPRQAEFVTTGVLKGASCKLSAGRGIPAAMIEGDCVAVVFSADGKGTSFPVDRGYSRLIGKEVSVVKTGQNEYRIVGDE
jgi:hypothetical protein